MQRIEELANVSKSLYIWTRMKFFQDPVQQIIKPSEERSGNIIFFCCVMPEIFSPHQKAPLEWTFNKYLLIESNYTNYTRFSFIALMTYTITL